MNANRTTRSLVLGALFLFTAGASADPASQPAGAGPTGWPQYRGPNRDNVAVNCPKLLDAWPNEGPPLAWKSELIPGWYQGGCSGPVVSDGKVFVYATAKNPVGGGNLYKLITPEVLASLGWMPDLPADLAKKIEDAWISKKRPNYSGWPWWKIKDPKAKQKDLEDYLAKKPELKTYISDFIATLKPEEATTYGDSINNRLCIPATTPYEQGVPWEGLEKLSKLQGVGYATCREWASATGSQLGFHLEFRPNWFESAWCRSFTKSDVLVCLDAGTGKTLWKKDFPLETLDAKSMGMEWMSPLQVLGVCATPAVWSGKCYFAGAAGLYCLSTKDGELLWQVKRKPEHASPLIADGVVYDCGSAYNAETGELLWKTPLWKGNGHYGPSFVVFGGKTYIFSTCSDGLCCLDLQTGKDIWKLKCAGAWTAEVQVSGDVLIAQGKMYKMTATGIQPVKTLVEFPGASFGLSWIIYQDHLYQYVFKGEMSARSPQSEKYNGLCCVDLKSGDLKWAYKGPTCTWDTDYAPALLADGKVFASFGSGGNFMSLNDSVAMYRPTPDRYVLLGTFKPGLIPWTPMALAGGKLFVRTEAGISCYDVQEHGVYLNGVMARNDAVAFRFGQTGGGLWEKGLADIVISGPAGVEPAKAKIDGDAIVVDIKDAAVPFEISYANGGALRGKNDLPLPPFGWNGTHALACRKCLENTIELRSNAPLDQENWKDAATYVIAGATVTNARIIRSGVILTTDKAWKPGDVLKLTYPCLQVDQGDARRETLTFTVPGKDAETKVAADVLLWWKLKEGMGVTAEDASGRTNDGILDGKVAWVQGRAKGALSFPRGADSFASVATVNGLNAGNTPHTIAIWVKVARLPEKRAWILLLGAEGGGSHHWLVHDNGEASFGVWAGGQVRSRLDVGKWKHVVTTFDGTTLTAYLNGEKVGSVAAKFDLKGVPLTVAKAYFGESCFEGEFDDLRLYDRALSAKEVADLAKAEAK